MNKMKLNEVEFSYTLNKKKFNYEIVWQSSDGQNGKSYLGRSVNDYDVSKFFRLYVLGIKTTSDYKRLGCR